MMKLYHFLVKFDIKNIYHKTEVELTTLCFWYTTS